MNQQVLEAKKQAVNDIKDGLKSSQTIAIVSYQGLTVKEIQELRKALRDADATFGVYKNTLVERALEEQQDPALKDLLEGPNGLVFSKDLSKGAKALVRFSRFHEKLVIKGGIVAGKATDKDGIVEISKIPGKEGLISMFLSVLEAPARNLAYSLSQIAESKSKQPGAPAPAAN